MNIKTIVGTLVASAALASAIVGPSQAQPQTTFGSFSSGSAANVTYTSGGNLAISSTNNSATATYTRSTPAITIAPVDYTFTGMADDGAATTAGDGKITQMFTGGTFQVVAGSPAAYTLPPVGSFPAGTVLLSGSFGGVSLSGYGGTQVGGIVTTFENVVYDPGYFLDTGLYNPGTFSIALTSVADPFEVNTSNGRLNDFSAFGVGSFTASPAVPEPSSVAAFAFTGMGIMGLMLFARKRRSSMTA